MLGLIITTMQMVIVLWLTYTVCRLSRERTEHLAEIARLTAVAADRADDTDRYLNLHRLSANIINDLVRQIAEQEDNAPAEPTDAIRLSVPPISRQLIRKEQV